jgi:hypothetical protein
MVAVVSRNRVRRTAPIARRTSLTHSAIADEFAAAHSGHLEANWPWSHRRKNRSTMRMRWPAGSLLN